jgi:hypothetical protein
MLANRGGIARRASVHDHEIDIRFAPDGIPRLVVFGKCNELFADLERCILNDEVAGKWSIDRIESECPDNSFRARSVVYLRNLKSNKSEKPPSFTTRTSWALMRPSPLIASRNATLCSLWS